MGRKRERSITSDALSVTAILAVSKLFGFVRQMVQSSKFGSNPLTNAFTTANSIPTILQSLILASVLATFIPIYSGIGDKESKKNADRFANKVLTVAVLFTLLLSALCIFASEFLAKIFGPGYTPETQQITAHLLRIQAPLLIFTAVMAVCQNYLNAHRKYALAQTTGFPLNILSIGCMLLLESRMGIDAAAWGILLGTAGQALLLWFFVRGDYHMRFELDLNDKNLRRMFVLMLPALLSATVTDLSTTADGIFASIANPDSGTTDLSYAWRLNNLVIGSVSVAASSIVYTRLSDLVIADDMPGFKRILTGSMMGIISIMAPIVVVACVMNTDIVRLVYERGKFGPQATARAAYAFLFYAPSILGASLRDIIIRGFYAINDTRTPFINGILTVSINILLNWILSNVMGIGGIALATSISYFAGGAITATLMSRKLGGLGLKAMLGGFLKTAICLAVQVFVTIEISGLLHTGVFVRLALTALASLTVYAAIGYAIQAPGIRPAFAWAGGKLGIKR